MSTEKDIMIPVDRETFMHHQYHLLTAKPYEDYGEEAAVDWFFAELHGDYGFEAIIYNCPRESGGPYIDPVVIRSTESGWVDALVLEVISDLETQLGFDIDGHSYLVGFERKEKDD